MSIIYLAKANNDFVSHCSCETAYVTFPGQMDCPWCGCGWLFTCMDCRKAFTFAHAIQVEQSWEQLAVRDITGRSGRPPDKDDVREWVEAMKELHAEIDLGQEYVYIDGMYVSASTGGIVFEGWYASHELAYVPQVVAVSNRSIIDETLGSEEYWRTNALREVDE